MCQEDFPPKIIKTGQNTDLKALATYFPASDLSNDPSTSLEKHWFVCLAIHTLTHTHAHAQSSQAFIIQKNMLQYRSRSHKRMIAMVIFKYKIKRKTHLNMIQSKCVGPRKAARWFFFYKVKERKSRGKKKCLQMIRTKKKR